VVGVAVAGECGAEEGRGADEEVFVREEADWFFFAGGGVGAADD